MMYTFCTQISLMRFFRGSVIAYSNCFSVDGNTCSPLVLKLNNTHKTGLVSFVWAAHVLGVTRLIYQSKIVQLVIRFVPVDVVNQTIWPTFISNKPRQPVRFINAFVDTDSDVPLSINAPSNVTNLNATGNTFAPHKFPSFWAVIQYLFDGFGGKIGVAHFDSPVMGFNINTGITK